MLVLINNPSSYLGVDTLSTGEVTWVGVGALVNVHTLGQVYKLLIFSTRDDVGPDKSEALVTPHTHAVLVVVGLLRLPLHEAILDDREVEAPLPRAVGNTGGPGAIALTQQGGQS